MLAARRIFSEVSGFCRSGFLGIPRQRLASLSKPKQRTTRRLSQERWSLAVLAVLGGTAAAGILVRQVLNRRRKDKKQNKREQTQENISTWIVSKSLLEADQAQVFSDKQELRETLSEVDEWLCRSSHWLGFCYRFDDVLDENQVKAGLKDALAHFPALGARVDASDELVLSPSQHGVIWEVARGRARRADLLPNESSHREQWKAAGLDAPPAGFQGTPGLEDPLFKCRLTLFEKEKVSYLSIGISHGLGDGHSITDILQVWSHFCQSSASVENLPSRLPPPRRFGHRVTEALRPAQTRQELQERLKEDVGCELNPLSSWTFYRHILPRALWTMGRQRVLELRLSAARLSTLKAAVQHALPQGEWVSRFEVLCAAVLVAQRATSHRRGRRHDVLHVACNLRGRVARFGDAHYFGNASFDFRQPLVLVQDVQWDLVSLVSVAREIHRAIRTGLAHPEEICHTKDWFEAARHLGWKNTYDVWPILFDTLQDAGTFCNSWDAARWMDISIGTPNKARAFQAYFGVAQNLIVEVPRHGKTGDTTVHLALSPAQAHNFVEFCRQDQQANSFQPPLPFDIVVDNKQE